MTLSDLIGSSIPEEPTVVHPRYVSLVEWETSRLAACHNLEMISQANLCFVFMPPRHNSKYGPKGARIFVQHLEVMG